VAGRAAGIDAGADLTAEVDLTVAARANGPARPPGAGGRSRTRSARCPASSARGSCPASSAQVDELHVLTTLDKQAKQAVRDVQTVLMARFGVPTDHRVISVVQLDELDGPLQRQPCRHRPGGLTQSGGRVTDRGRAALDGRTSSLGTAETASSASARVRAVATPRSGGPTADRRRLRVELEAAEVTDVLGHQARGHPRPAPRPVAGADPGRCALVRDDEADAIARAVLDALNRTIEDAALTPPLRPPGMGGRSALLIRTPSSRARRRAPPASTRGSPPAHGGPRRGPTAPAG
jgi:hypothetical protein